MWLQVFPVTEDVWCVRRWSYLTCSYLVRTPLGIVLLDAGMDSTGGDIEVALHRAFGATPRDVKAILLTHWHNDHAAGAQAIQNQSGAKIYFHRGDEPQLTGASATGGLRQWLAARIPELGPLVLFKGLLGEATPRPVKADRLLVDGDRVEDFFEVIETPGHTPGHLSFYYPREKMLFAGDALAVIRGHVRFMARHVTLELPAARRSMFRCLERPIEHLCPGHRVPLSDQTQARCDEFRARLERDERWPLLG